jgi:integrase/recombinase XerD
MFELLYATGLRVSELVGIRLFELSLNDNVVRVMGKGSKESLVPLGEVAADWLRRYLAGARNELLKQHVSDAIFITVRGAGMTRQMFWNLVKKYALQVGIPRSAFRPTCCAMPSPPTCSTTAPTCAWCSCCSATPTSRPRRSTPMSRANA